MGGVVLLILITLNNFENQFGKYPFPNVPFCVFTRTVSSILNFRFWLEILRCFNYTNSGFLSASIGVVPNVLCFELLY